MFVVPLLRHAGGAEPGGMIFSIDTSAGSIVAVLASEREFESFAALTESLIPAGMELYALGMRDVGFDDVVAAFAAQLEAARARMVADDDPPYAQLVISLASG